MTYAEQGKQMLLRGEFIAVALAVEFAVGVPVTVVISFEQPIGHSIPGTLL